MRTLCLSAAISSVALGLLALHGAACFDFQDNCALNPILHCGPWSGSLCWPGGPDGGDGGPTPSCIPSENDAGVADTCGVFVSSSKGDDTNVAGPRARRSRRSRRR